MHGSEWLAARGPGRQRVGTIVLLQEGKSFFTINKGKCQWLKTSQTIAPENAIAPANISMQKQGVMCVSCYRATCCTYKLSPRVYKKPIRGCCNEFSSIIIWYRCSPLGNRLTARTGSAAFRRAFRRLSKDDGTGNRFCA